MTTYYLTYPIESVSKKDQVLAIGFFDGIHIGHQQVINRAIKLARRLNCSPAVLTFHPHPLEVIGELPNSMSYITPLSEKIIQFKRFEVETVHIMEFTPRFAELSKEMFLDEVLCSLSAKGVVTGFNFTFGKGAVGNVDDLKYLGKGRFEVDIVEPIEKNKQIISSTRLRAALGKGDIEEVTAILGRHYAIEGKVITGDQRGREMGFPTANLSLLQSFLVPRYGVYVVRVTLEDGQKIQGIMNIGVRPTVSQHISQERLEVHLFNWEESLYDKVLRIEFLHYLRQERKFPSVADLKYQIQKDIEEAKLWFEKGVSSISI